MYQEFLNASNVITEVNPILRNNGGVVVNPCANHTHDDSTRYRIDNVETSLEYTLIQRQFWKQLIKEKHHSVFWEMRLFRY